MGIRTLLSADLLASGVPLAADPRENAGVAWTKEGAQIVLAWLLEKSFAVPGGEVHEVRGGKVRNISTWDMWHCDPLPGETLPSYAARSIAFALEYIANYREPTGAMILYEIVAADRIHTQ